MTVAGTTSEPGNEDPIEVAFRDVPWALLCILTSYFLLYLANYYSLARNGAHFLLHHEMPRHVVPSLPRHIVGMEIAQHGGQASATLSTGLLDDPGTAI
ncbi:hypothetical protein AOL_s00083g133 [Orbilia oligospora ATCC 24927]|uniref:Uncharacterized protein n=1 Tax=Arthrobotrys oligospora (strain ATCC 24927 / CBS 115.81 / DSM 1491) TaxID=756982 RepID=G1XGK2_ARTOA|nr:hypothetical protein AOL_s00083g133 [Orbilia oligospora ATCC 24927]EGX47625.1 hypothetical protein AOL_s00083g133 [Orbilia oligospora ATCC 24927]